jgi:hypothetical protein
MSEKIFTVKEDKTNKDYKLIMSYNSFTIEFILQNPTYIREKYESGNITLAAFQQKNKIFKQFDSVLKIADVIRNKIEKKQFILQPGALILKFHNEYDNIENVKFELKEAKVDSKNQSSTQKDDTYKKRIQDLNQKAKASNLSSGTSNPSSYKPQAQPKILNPPKVSPPPPPKPQPKPVSKPPQKPVNPPPSKPVDDKFFYKPTNNEIPIVGSYIPPSMNTNGTIFQRIEQCKKLKTDMKKTCEDIYNRLNDVKNRIDNFVDKAFANNPTAEDKKKALSLITEVMLLRQGFKDIDNYPEIFQNEVKQKHINFNAADKEKFEDDMLALGKAFPYALTPFHQKIDHLFIQVQHNFFKEKNLRFYKEKELANIIKMKEKLFNKL